MHDDGEPISRGHLDRRAAEARALRNTLTFVAVFTGAVLINGILAILLIELFQAIGGWEVRASEPVEDAMAEVSTRLRVRPAVAA
jgi:hypothetical protein